MVGIVLSEYLIPVLSEENTEKEAEELLRRYYPEALAMPQPIDAMFLANREFTVVDALLYSEQLFMMVQTVFYKGTVRIHNDRTDRDEEFRVESGMILVNSRCKMNEVQRNTTIIRELTGIMSMTCSYGFGCYTEMIFAAFAARR